MHDLVGEQLPAGVRSGSEFTRSENHVPAHRIRAGDVGDALCAPGVRWIEVVDGWYEVVTAPWDPQGLGPGECPVVDGRCPEHCADLYGSALDGPTRCAPTARIVACSRQETLASNGQAQCRVEVATGWTAKRGIPTARAAARLRLTVRGAGAGAETVLATGALKVRAGMGRLG